MPEENKPVEEDKQTPEELVETYAFFSNPVKVAITLHDGMKLILGKLKTLEEKVDKLSGNQR